MLVYNDFNTTVHKALDEIDKRWREYDGLILCGTHSPDGFDAEAQIELIKQYREQNRPILGICYGHQLAAIEYARNVLKIKDATSEEFGTGTLVVKKLPALKVGLHDGETYWNNYEVTPEILEQWKKPPNVHTVQYHPEYMSTKKKPHPFLKRFLQYAKSKT